MAQNDDDPLDGLSEAAKLVIRRLRGLTVAPVWIALFGVCVDVPSLAVAFWFADYATTPAASFSATGAMVESALMAVTAVAMLLVVKAYAPQNLRSVKRSVVRTVPVLGLSVAVLAIGHAGQGTLGFLSAATFALALVCLPTRFAGIATVRWLLKMRLLDRRAVIAGGGENARELIRALGERPDNDIQVHGVFDDRDDERSPVQVLGVPKLGGYDDLVRFVRASEIDMVIISLPLEAEERIEWLLDVIKVLPVDVRLSAFSRSYTFDHRKRDPMISAMYRTFTPECRLAKRVLDTTLAVLALAALAPLMLLAALAIRLESPGPVLFKQRRHGYNNRVVTVWKFRSLRHETSDPAASDVVTRADPRVTRVGRLLRRTSVDELPQLFNVLKGELSLVGPRPHAIDAVSSDRERFSRIVEGYSTRHKLPPGMTGWAQVNGWRGEIDSPEKLRARLEHDLYYIENWSIWFDLKILLRTPFSLFGSNAY